MFRLNRMASALAVAGVTALVSVPASGSGTLTVDGNTYSLDAVSVQSDSSGIHVGVTFTDSTLTVNSSGDSAEGDAEDDTTEDDTTEDDTTEDDTTEDDTTEDDTTEDDTTEDDVVSGECGTVPAGVTYMGDLPRREDRFAMGSETLAFRLPPHSDTSTYGRAETVVTSTNQAYRTTWISTCPGGDPLDQTHRRLGQLCVEDNYETTSLNWNLDSDVTNECILQSGQEYYFNVRNAKDWSDPNSTCSASQCPFYGRSIVRTAN